jgi:hypothetical protein
VDCDPLELQDIDANVVAARFNPPLTMLGVLRRTEVEEEGDGERKAETARPKFSLLYTRHTSHTVTITPHISMALLVLPSLTVSGSPEFA